jgi:AcrR family transcriptional regulator
MEGIMSRIVKAPDERRQELIDIALKQFMLKGYEKTSVRSILKEVGGEIGMFYHYFKSKHEIYEAALNNYNDKYISKITYIINNNDLDFYEKLNYIFMDLSGSISEYSALYTEKINPDIMIILHSKTLQKMVSLFEKVIIENMEKKIINIPVPNTRLLSQFILLGVSAVIHDHEVKSIEEKINHIKLLLAKLLNIDAGGQDDGK